MEAWLRSIDFPRSQAPAWERTTPKLCFECAKRSFGRVRDEAELRHKKILQFSICNPLRAHWESHSFRTEAITVFCIRQQIREAFETDDLERALTLADSHLAGNEDDGRVWELKGLIHHARREFETALGALETASSLIPMNPAASVCLGQCYGRVGRKGLSRDVLVSLVDDSRLTCELLLQVATGLDAVDEPRIAMDVARKATQKDPLDGQGYYDMGFYAARAGHPPRIVESLARKALSLEPDNVGFRLGLASFLVKHGKSSDALEVVQNMTIERIHCRCCLERIVDLFESPGDFRRAVLCRQQLLNLELRNVDPDCE
jgi:tetratricopeptide (TPR) repeat protein